MAARQASSSRCITPVHWAVTRSFGVTSAAGVLTGALLNTWAASRTLELVFGSLLELAGASQVTGYAKRW
jgi:uncharacterized membrane protein YfcA